MDAYFRAHAKMGVRDRGFVAETVYGCLRQRRLLEQIAERADAASVVAAFLLTEGHSARALEEADYRDDARAMAERLHALDRASLPFAVRANLPDWLAERLRAQFGDAEAEALAQSLNQPAPVDLRVNTIKAERNAVRARLAEEGFPCEITPYSPAGLRREDRAPLFHTRCFKEGLFEVQDEGSQLLSVLLEPRRHEMVVDFCAGAGGKTLHLGALMANTGTVYAFDVSARRLERLKPRLKRAGLDNVRAVAIAHERDARVQRLAGKIDRVLVDAPCSGTGTLRRNPDIKWRETDVAELTEAQRRILAAAAELVKPGGRLVYATCSLLREENEDIVEEFLAGHAEFVAVPVNEILERRHIVLPPCLPAPHPSPAKREGESEASFLYDRALRLLTHRHHTDTFYAVALERTT
jgi:16S rRNA (cytosine967-C5)-methyltransferase